MTISYVHRHISDCMHHSLDMQEVMMRLDSLEREMRKILKARHLLDALFTKKEQKGSPIYKFAKSEKSALDEDRVAISLH